MQVTYSKYESVYEFVPHDNTQTPILVAICIFYGILTKGFYFAFVNKFKILLIDTARILLSSQTINL